MEKTVKQRFVLFACCLLGAILSWRYSLKLDGSEFSGGTVTGPILTMQNVAAYLYGAAVLVTLRYRKIGAGTALAASALFLPMCLYQLAPGIFRKFFRTEFSIPVPGPVSWDAWAAAGITVLAVTVYVSVRNLSDTTAVGHGQP